MRTVGLKLLALTLTTLLTASCAPVSLVNSWRNPAAPQRTFSKLLVVSVASDTAARQLFETVLVAELKGHGVDAIPGSSLIRGNDASDRSVVEKAVRDSGSGGIVSLQLDRVTGQSTVIPGYTVTYSMGWYPDTFSSWDFYNYYGSTTVVVPPTVITDVKWMIRATLFGADDGKLLWAGTFQTDRPEQYIAIGKDVAQTVVNRLSREGMI